MFWAFQILLYKVLCYREKKNTVFEFICSKFASLFLQNLGIYTMIISAEIYRGFLTWVRLGWLFFWQT